MLKINSTTFRLVLSSLLFICLYTSSAFCATANNHSQANFFQHFSGNLATELTLAKEQKKFGVLLFFGTKHCPFCRRMKRTVFNQINVQQHYQSHFRLLDIDIESTQHLTDEKNQRLSHIDYAKAHRVRLTPTIVFLDLNGELRYRQVGMIADPQEFIWLAQYVTSGQTKEQNFSTYKMHKRSRHQGQ